MTVLQSLLSNPWVVTSLLTGIVALWGLAVNQLHQVLERHKNGKNNALLAAIDLVGATSLTVVRSLEQSLRPTLSEPGVALTAEGQERIRRAALVGVKDALASSASPAAKQAMDLGEEWILHTIEDAVGRMKVSAASRGMTVMAKYAPPPSASAIASP